MQTYKYKNNKNVIIAELDKKEIYRIDFASCKNPTQTLKSFYNSQSTKPTLLVNGGFFNMSTGEPVFNFIDDGESKSINAKYQWGMGIIDDADLIYSSKTSRKWKDFISGYPNLIDNGQILPITFATELNYKARRTALGYNDNKIFVVCVMSPGMNFTELQQVLSDIGCKYAINLDGGGSTNMLYNGTQMTTDGYNRPVDNVLAFYLNENTDSKNNTPSTSSANNSVQYTKYNSEILTPDNIINAKIGSSTIQIKQKICPDNLLASKDIASYVKKDDHMKPCALVNDGSGKPRGITIHNTGAFTPKTGTTMAEQSARAFYNGNGGGAVVHYFVDDTSIWQLLCADKNKVERGWHASDGSARTFTTHNGSKYDKIGGNIDTIAIECIGNSSAAETRAAMLIAYLCNIHDLDPSIDVYTHNFFMNQEEKIVSVKKDSSKVTKNCPVYILPHLSTFINKCKTYYNSIKNASNSSTSSSSSSTTSTAKTYYKVMVDGCFAYYSNAKSYKAIIDTVFNISSLIKKVDDKYYIQCATYSSKAYADAFAQKLTAYGIDAIVV